MPPLLASNPAQSILLKSHLHPHNLSALSFHTINPKFTCLSCSSPISFPTSGFPTNLSLLKSNARSKGAFLTTRSSNDAFNSNQASEKLEDPNEKSLNGKVDVRALALTLHNAQNADDVDELLKDYPDLPLQVYTCIIRGLGNSRRLDAAFAVVEWLKKNKTLNQLIYNSLLGAVKANKRFDKVTDVIEDMKLQGFLPNIVTYNTLMSIYIEQGKPKEVFNLISQIEAAGLSPSAATYSTILSAYKELEDANGLLEYFSKLREKYQVGELQRDSCEEDWEKEFVKLDNLTVKLCQSLMHKWFEENNTTEILGFVNCMDKAGVKLDQNFFERVFWACRRAEHYTVVRELYKRLRESGVGGDVSVAVYNHIIWVMGKAKKWWAALKVYEEMLERGPIPDDNSFDLVLSNFTLLVAATKRTKHWKWGIQLLDKMQERGLVPSTKQWNLVLNACSKAGEIDAAVEVFQKMVQKGERPTVQTYGVLLNALQRGALYDEATRVWDHMQKVGVKPNLHAYTMLASMYAQKGDHSMADSVLQQMVAARIEPTVVTFNAIISSCVKGQMVPAAFEWFSRMKGMNVKPDVISYEVLIEALVQDSKPRLAYEMYVEACQEGFVLNKKVHRLVFEAGQVDGSSVHVDTLGVPGQAGLVAVEAGLEKKPIQTKNNQTEFCGSPSQSSHLLVLRNEM